MSDILMISGGEVDITSSSVYLRERKYDCTVAVDGGLAAAFKLGLNPDIVVGDFDTVDLSLLEKAENQGARVVRLNPQKDDTDTLAALKLVCEKYCGPDAGKTARKETAQKITAGQPACRVDIIGAIGTRFDHTAANIFILKFAMQMGVECHIIDRLNRLSLVTGKKTIKKSGQYGDYISFVQFDGKALGVTLKGFAYDVSDFDFDAEKTTRLGVSNEIRDEEAAIEIREGCMLMIEAKDDRKWIKQ